MASRYEITDAVMKTVNLGGAVSVFQAGAGASAQIKDLQGNNLTVYQAETGATTVANPLTVDSAGRIEGWVEAPDFKVTISGTGITTYTQEIRQSPSGHFNVKSYGATGGGITDDTAAIQAAITAAGTVGGTLFFPPGTYLVSSQIAISAINVNVLCSGATLKASGALSSVLLYNKVTTQPESGVHGLTIDMNSTASIGLEVKNCWSTDHNVRIINPGTGTGVKVHTDDSSFGCYYNRVNAICDGTTGAGSIGVLVQGQSGSNKTNHNILDRVHITNMETGVKIGTNVGAMTLARADVTNCTYAYDFVEGTTHLRECWEEGNTTYGFVVRTGAVARGTALYFEKSRAEGTGELLLNDAWTLGGTGAANIDNGFSTTGNWGMTVRHEASSGAFVLLKDGVEQARISRLGVLTANGDLILSTAGKGLNVKEGSNARMGTATLVAGTVVVSTTAVATGDRIFITPVNTGGTAGHLSYTISNGTSFTVTSTSGTDTRTFNWMIVRPS